MPERRRPPAGAGEGAEPPSLESLRGRALALLTRREHSRAELEARLRATGADDGQVALVLQELADRHLQSDSRFAEAFVRSRVLRGQGPRVIAAELRQRGVDPALAAVALAAADADWHGRATELRRRRFGDALPTDARERARQMRFLQYRGFSGEQIRQALGGGSETD
ncbi:MAG: regulatory protein RecX [Moraxellaceae bacterium]